MKGLIASIAVTAIAFVIVAYLLPQVDFTGGFVQLIVLAVVFGLVNGLVKPIVKLLAFPINLMTLGLVGVVINGVMLLLVAWAADSFFQAGLTIGGFPAKGISLDAITGAVLAALVLSITQAILGLVIKD
ncbi:MAG: phage holin family protein [Chloroflexota bacterium]